MANESKTMTKAAPAPAGDGAAVTSQRPRAAATSALAVMKRDVVDVVGGRISGLIQSGELHLPSDYSAENALKAAWLALQVCEDKDHRKALAICTPDSIANALLDMIVQGLTPARQQCYFIVYGNRLVLQRSYFGSISLVRRIYGQSTEVWSEVVYEGDEFEYEIIRGSKRIVKHVQNLENVKDAKIIAAYAVVEPAGGRPPHTEVMTLDQIQRAWQQGATKGGSPAHKNFGGEMCKKTVINRVCKVLMNAASDAHLVRAARRQEVATVAAEVAAEIGAGPEPEVLALPEETAGESSSSSEPDPEVAQAEAARRAEREPGEDDDGNDGQLDFGPAGEKGAGGPGF